MPVEARLKPVERLAVSFLELVQPWLKPEEDIEVEEFEQQEFDLDELERRKEEAEEARHRCSGPREGKPGDLEGAAGLPGDICSCALARDRLRWAEGPVCASSLKGGAAGLTPLPRLHCRRSTRTRRASLWMTGRWRRQSSTTR